jgi:hypothetical protein
MKAFKNKIKNLFIIILCVFAIIPIMFLLLKLNPYQREAYTNYDSLSNKNKNMPRVDISGVTIKYGNENESSYTGKSGEHLYCPAGEIKCPDGYETQSLEDYKDPNGKSQKSYKYWCKNTSTGEISDISHVLCENNYLGKDGINKLYIRSENDKDENGNILTHNVNDITSTSGKGLTNTGLNGFSDPYDHIPMSVSGEYLILYKQDQSVNFKATPCFLYEDSATCISNYYDSSSNESSGNSCDSDQPIKCVADNGANVGDPLCCGQTGVVQDTKYNCPSNYPYCVGYKCGESWGKCVSSSSS